MNWETLIPWIVFGIVLVVGIAIAAICFIKASPEQRREMINKILFALAIEAERLYGSKTGQAKKAQVIAWFYERYGWLSRFVTEEQLGEWIDTVVEYMTEWLASNPAAAKNILGGEVKTSEQTDSRAESDNDTADCI